MSMLLRNKGVHERHLIKNRLLMGLFLNWKILFNWLIYSPFIWPWVAFTAFISSADSKDQAVRTISLHLRLSLSPSYVHLSICPPSAPSLLHFHSSSPSLVTSLPPSVVCFPLHPCPAWLRARLMKEPPLLYCLALILISSLIYWTQQTPHSAQFNFVVFLCVSLECACVCVWVCVSSGRVINW